MHRGAALLCPHCARPLFASADSADRATGRLFTGVPCDSCGREVDIEDFRAAWYRRAPLARPVPAR